MVCRSGFLLFGVMKMLAQRKLNLDGKHAVLLADRRRAVILCHAVFHIPDAVPVHIAGLLPLLGRNGIVDCVKQRVVLLAQGKGDGGRIRRGYLLAGFDGVINGIAHNDVQIHRADGQLIGNPHIEVQGNPLILNLLQRTFQNPVDDGIPHVYGLMNFGQRCGGLLQALDGVFHISVLE